MIALFTTYFVVFYLLVPGILFRFNSSFYVRLKLFQRTRTQEATFAVTVALLPFAIALISVWYVPLTRSYPFPIDGTSIAERRQDYHRIAGLLTSSDAAKMLNATPSLAIAPRDTNWASLNRVLRRQARFLAWYYLAIAAEGLLFGYLASRYGDWQTVESASERRSRRKNKRSAPIRAYNWIARKFILPNISEWHMLLTDFNFPKRDDLFVSADILQTDGHLYKGRVVDYFIDSDGKLTGILLKDVVRFDRQSYLDQKKASASPDQVFADDFWKYIPSQNFYIGQSSISNLNVRFAPREDRTLLDLADEVLQQEDFQDTDVVEISPDGTERRVDTEDSNGHPDIYS